MLMDKFDLCYDFLIHITPPPPPRPPNPLGPKWERDPNLREKKKPICPCFQAIQGNVLILELKFLELEFCVKLDFHMVDFRVIFATVNAANVAFPVKKAKWNSILQSRVP